MIILGTRGVTSRQGGGTFYCPQCRAERSYEHKLMRRFFTLYFIPVIPLDRLGEYVECGTCRGTFQPGVLEIDVQAVQSVAERQFIEHLERVLVLIMIADGAADEYELGAVQDYLERAGAARPTTEELARQVRLARAAQTTAAGYAAGVADEISEEGKRKMVEGAFLVATARGPLDDLHRAQLEQLPAALGMSEPAFREIIRQAAEGS